MNHLCDVQFPFNHNTFDFSRLQTSSVALALPLHKQNLYETMD